MELLSKLEHKIYGWFKSFPGLPAGARKWLGDNVWWIVVISAVLVTISAINNLITLNGQI